MRKMKVCELIVDFGLYPRASIDTHHVGEMRKALDAGVAFPPIVIDKKSKRIIDGVHRSRMYAAAFGKDHEVEVVEKSYKSEAEMFLDAARYNAAHGLRMDTHDKAHCIVRAMALGIDDASIADAMHVPAAYVQELRVGRMAVGSEGLTVPLKSTMKHLAGSNLTNAQQAANDKMSGMQQVFYVNQVITLIESGSLNTADAALLERLRVLGELIAAMAVEA
jgi:hypothetical protein